MKRILALGFCLCLLLTFTRLALAAEPAWQETLRAHSKHNNPGMIDRGPIGTYHYTIPEEVAKILENQKADELLPFLTQMASVPEIPTWQSTTIQSWINIVKNGLKGTPGVIHSRLTNAKGEVIRHKDIPVYYYTYHNLGPNKS